MYFNVNFNVSFKLIKVHLLVSELSWDLIFVWGSHFADAALIQELKLMKLINLKQYITQKYCFIDKIFYLF